MKTLKELTLMDRFLFAETMNDPGAHEAALQIILGDDEIRLLDKPQTEKELRTAPWLHSIRMDVYAVDDRRTVYNTEMQKEQRNDLIRRSRYYQAVVDTSLLAPGTLKYNELYDSFVIMIMPFDLFGLGKYCYTFKGNCLEAPECFIDDGATRIFLNTRGTNDDEVSKELRDFLHYCENTDDASAEASGSGRIRKIHEHVKEIRASEEMGVKFMNAWEEKMYERLEGKAEGKAESVIELLDSCGDVPDELRAEIMAEQDLDILKNWLKLAARCGSIEAFTDAYKSEQLV